MTETTPAPITSQFEGLPIETLIAAPLLAAAEGQKSLAHTTASFIKEIGLNEQGETIGVKFQMNDGEKDVELNAPLLSIVNVPSLMVDTIDVDFQMEVSAQQASNNSTEVSAEVKASGGFACWKASFTGKVSHSNSSNRSSDSSAKYQVKVHGKQEKPEGLNRMLDLLNSTIGQNPATPTPKVTPPNQQG